MQKKLLATPALAGFVALPIAGYATFYLMEESPFAFGAGQRSARAGRQRRVDSDAHRAERAEARQGDEGRRRKADDEACSSRDVGTDLLEAAEAPKTETRRRRPEQDRTPRAMSRRPSRRRTIAPSTCARRRGGLLPAASLATERTRALPNRS